MGLLQSPRRVLIVFVLLAAAVYVIGPDKAGVSGSLPTTGLSKSGCSGTSFVTRGRCG